MCQLRWQHGSLRRRINNPQHPSFYLPFAHSGHIVRFVKHNEVAMWTDANLLFLSLLHGPVHTARLARMEIGVVDHA